jgi:ABC-type multidrug transport system fused ATPase/permease subunit
MMYRPIRQMADNFNVLQMGMINAERVFQMLDRDESQKSVDAPQDEMRGEVTFEKVDFAYVDEQWVLSKFDLKVKEGEMIALVGHTGSGKSTIVQLVNRLYEPQSGTVSIDGKDVNDWSLDALRNKIAVVPQEVFLFSDSIYNNLTLFDTTISKERVIAACERVGIHDFIMQLPGDYQFDVRERGAVLSVGQRQLLAFVRAYLRDPAILILDEATSSIDSESEKLIQKATQIITEGRTSFVVAHRLSTIQEADRILVLDKGKVIEEGNHETLMALNGHYQRMYNLQFDEQ